MSAPDDANALGPAGGEAVLGLVGLVGLGAVACLVEEPLHLKP